MIKNPLSVLVLDGTLYNIAKVKNATGVVAEINRAELNTQINASPIERDLHALIIERAAEGQVQKIGENAQLYEGNKDDSAVGMKYKGGILLLLGHQRVASSAGAKVKVFLTTTVSLKNSRAKIDTTVPAPAEEPKVTPATHHPAEFRNAPRIVNHKPRTESWGGENKVKHYGSR